MQALKRFSYLKLSGMEITGAKEKKVEGAPMTQTVGSFSISSSVASRKASHIIFCLF